MENKIDYKTLVNFSEGKYSYNDYLRVKHWFIRVKNDKSTEEHLFNQWKEFKDQTNTKSLHLMFEKIHYQILLEEKKNKSIKKNIWYYYRRTAAILIPIMALSVLLYFMSNSREPSAQPWVEINVPNGARLEFLLPDSTSGWLNSGSKLKYSPEFNSRREVKLTGEAFFNVRHKDHSFFIVNVADLDIKVLGTQFNVSAYPNEILTDVVLEEGKVEITDKEGAFKHVLKPGEKISHNRKVNSSSVQYVDPKLYTSWKDGYLVIDNEPLSNAIRKIERWYNAEITLQNEALNNVRFKATIKEESLEDVLHFMSITTPITFAIEKRDYDTNGTINKKHVTIKLK